MGLVDRLCHNVSASAAKGGVMTGPDAHWRDELTLVGGLSTINRELALYVMRLLDVDAERAPEPLVAEEAALGNRMVELGHAIHARAARRGPRLDPPSDR
ncbi:hypothetical protein [Actinokineospora sp. HUAS TT18]|uniref:hypothetical protein n=1 Tax=Actinokineospora sp. HUAS TT18 TaxID=3447451 RepID=UPI003F5245F1